MRGVIDRRMLVNFRVDPDVLAPLAPPPFRPKIVHGWGIVGICLIRLKQIRPAFLPAWMGITSENVAHRIAVEWEANGVPLEGVYIRRRDTSARLNAWAGGRLFPGIHHHAQFAVAETAKRFTVAVRSDDGLTQLSVRARLADRFTSESIFTSLAEASDFFRMGSLGYSTTPEATRFQGLELRCRDWKVEPLDVEAVESSYFDDRALFPARSVQFDCALLMRGVEHEWHSHADLCCAAPRNACLSGVA
jgi:hypothetical protein